MMTEEQARKRNFEKLDSLIGFLGYSVLSGQAQQADSLIIAGLLAVIALILLFHYIASGDYK